MPPRGGRLQIGTGGRDQLERVAGFKSESPADFRRNRWPKCVGIRKQIPVARMGQPEDIAHTASFLCSEGASFVSGQVIYVAGGPKD